MSVRYVLAPQAVLDLVEIWRYIKQQSSLTIADRVEAAIRENSRVWRKHRASATAVRTLLTRT
jgi:plasmid stabilization system protein ParE